MYVQKPYSEATFNQYYMIKVLWKNKTTFLTGVMGKGIFGRAYGTSALSGRKGGISTGNSGDGSFQAKEGTGAVVPV